MKRWWDLPQIDRERIFNVLQKLSIDRFDHTDGAMAALEVLADTAPANNQYDKRMTCPICSQVVLGGIVDEEILCGKAGSQESIHCRVLRGICPTCTLEFTDYRAEGTRADAIREHLSKKKQQLIMNGTREDARRRDLQCRSLLKRLGVYWEKHRELRLGQLIVNLTRMATGEQAARIESVFHVHDGELIRVLESLGVTS